jgi:hypothetical protein
MGGHATDDKYYQFGRQIAAESKLDDAVKAEFLSAAGRLDAKERERRKAQGPAFTPLTPRPQGGNK